ncbi:iron permease FTR1 [Jaminaea rosea]|uniref:Iron permease FTR1 n=1 Tax=Jaminaea rosea TaxID=1569628 RepID=A0A316UJU8_9BASI|nr:iron permease FTR1 [Jaminaea rosea]PWN25546.1 iron permease FTR1 [Jaminaea rosea]
MGQNVFAPSIFFITFRESLEAALVVGTLMGMLESLAHDLLPDSKSSSASSTVGNSEESKEASTPNGSSEERKEAIGPNDSTSSTNVNGNADAEIDANHAERRVLIKKLRKLVLLGAGCGLGIAFIIGAIFLAVFYTQSNDLYAKAEELWEGIFCLIATLLLTPMSLAILRADQSKAKWRRKMNKAFAGKLNSSQVEDNIAVAGMVQRVESKDVPATTPASERVPHLTNAETGKASLGSRILEAIKAPFRKANRGSTILFTIPFVTTLREGLEAVVFVGGVSLGLPATSIPLAAIVGLACGFLIGYIVFRAGGFGKIKIFLLFSTCLLLLIAAGLFSRCIYYFQFYRYVQKVGDGAAEGGDGNGSFDALNYVFHLDYANPENNDGGWGLLNALVGWNNTGTLGSILGYVFYWIVVVAWLVYIMAKEKRLPGQKKQAVVL